jgi:choloylglycine hydrolase
MCTGIVKQAKDGSVVFARTLEFGVDLISFDLLFVPRGTPSSFQTNKAWVTTHAYVGFNPFGLPLVADGLSKQLSPKGESF